MSQHESIGLSDEWYTPKYIFDALGAIFDMDVAAPISLEHVKTPTDTFITNRSLEREWKGLVWCNPPFGGRNGIIPWVEKMSYHGNGILLTPDRTSTDWWQDCAIKSKGVLFVRSKIKFIKPDGSLGKQPSVGTTLFAFGSQAVAHLLMAQENKLGFFTFNNPYNAKP